MEYPIVLEREDDGPYSVYAPDLPGCVSWGQSREDAIKNIREAMELWIGSAQDAQEDVPAPGASLVYVRIG